MNGSSEFTAPPTEEEVRLTAGMPPAIAAGFIMSRREAALQADIRQTFESMSQEPHDPA